MMFCWRVVYDPKRGEITIVLLFLKSDADQMKSILEEGF
jgi:hypothetical protein